jgi:hypothetical protein
MAARATKRKKQKPFWERGFQSHGYWLGKSKVGIVSLGKRGEWDGVYRWQAGSCAGKAKTLQEAKQAVEQAVLVGASQLQLFEE